MSNSRTRSDEDAEHLFREYKTTRDTQIRDRLVLRVTSHEHAASLIVSMAGTVILRLPATTS